MITRKASRILYALVVERSFPLSAMRNSSQPLTPAQEMAVILLPALAGIALLVGFSCMRDATAIRQLPPVTIRPPLHP
jgi:hypothetical protein